MFKILSCLENTNYLFGSGMDEVAPHDHDALGFLNARRHASRMQRVVHAHELRIDLEYDVLDHMRF